MDNRKKETLITELTKLLDKGIIITNSLKEAIESTITAIKEEDLNLAYQITACKSFISELKCERKLYAFREDSRVNRKKLGYSVYEKLDEIHHDFAWMVNSMPSGIVKISSDMKFRSMEVVGNHPIVKRIKYEREQLNKEMLNRTI